MISPVFSLWRWNRFFSYVFSVGKKKKQRKQRSYSTLIQIEHANVANTATWSCRDRTHIGKSPPDSRHPSQYRSMRVSQNNKNNIKKSSDLSRVWRRSWVCFCNAYLAASKACAPRTQRLKNCIAPLSLDEALSRPPFDPKDARKPVSARVTAETVSSRRTSRVEGALGEEKIIMKKSMAMNLGPLLRDRDPRVHKS